ncbi:SDR family NAD(P)-dependent oxidoreductase [Streptomyces sp. ODS05-4]|uniref:SDR family NAD(P)-dependent oxidoreductase n=1 Tax=Streptomyces sp. ODS05-4 TaxID=2944939 RepID=UPI00210A1213|nr:SDR family NAD(P)-dependent oxidoreductase [Streptomyces sp. ODS05-4]
MIRWNETVLPELTGRVALVTGATGGLGRQTAGELARRGAHVVITGRDRRRGEGAVGALRRAGAAGELHWMPMELGDLSDVARFAEDFRGRYERLDLLVNNAGVMMPPEGRTADGFEQHFGVNHLGHFALTGRLLATLLATPDARVVTVTSASHHRGRLDADADPTGARAAGTHADTGPYRPFPAYALSKLANLVFAVELQRRLDSAGASVRSLAAQPPLTRTTIAAQAGRGARLMVRLGCPPARGVLPVLHAATAPDLRGGTLIAPGGRGGLWGSPAATPGAAAAHDPVLGAWLWGISQRMTGVPTLPNPQRTDTP